MEDIPVVILCGGLGTRLKEETEFKPKPMVEIGGIPILWHIMKIYSHQGFKDFILCLGYKGHMIKDYFLKYRLMANDFSMNLKKRDPMNYHTGSDEDWNITFAETGSETETGGRIKRIERYIKGDRFFLTYGDGVADINIIDLLNFHKSKGKIATLTAIQPMSRFGIVEFDKNNIITSFKEKPKLDGFINGGFFVLEKGVFNYLRGDKDIFEQEPLKNLAKDGQIVAYPHNGFWECMDTFKDVKRLEQLWEAKKASWKLW